MKVGILGGGQLGMMLVEAGKKLGLDFLVYSEAADVPAARVASLFLGRFDDEAALSKFAAQVDVVTYEWENVPAEAVKVLQSRGLKFFPDPSVLRLAQDRLVQKQYFHSLGIPTAPFCEVKGPTAGPDIHFPGILKTRRWGYDGKGQWRVNDADSFSAAVREAGEQELIFEEFISFDREVSLIGARESSGKTVFYPLVENLHARGILRTTFAPAEAVSETLQKLAESYLDRTLVALKYEGLATLELFQVGEELLVNELASRVHNSGHWSIEGASQSQFENHLRAGLGLGLERPKIIAPTAMLNLISEAPSAEVVKQFCPDAYVHSYGKTSQRHRKLGHVTVQAPNFTELKAKVEKLRRLIPLEA